MKTLLKLSQMGFPIESFYKYYKPDALRHMKILRHYQIDTVFDVGANIGQFGLSMRTLKYQGRIISFEPLGQAYAQLQANAGLDKQWILENYALGGEESTHTINISNNSMSSSFLGMKQLHVKNAPESKYIGQQEVKVRTLDAVFPQFATDKNNVWLKIDTQGFEKSVLEGGENTLRKIKILQLELSIEELYEGEMLYFEMIAYLRERGFKLISLENGFSNTQTGELLQADGVFLNTHLI